MYETLEPVSRTIETRSQRGKHFNPITIGQQFVTSTVFNHTHFTYGPCCTYESLTTYNNNSSNNLEISVPFYDSYVDTHNKN